MFDGFDPYIKSIFFSDIIWYAQFKCQIWIYLLIYFFKDFIKIIYNIFYKKIYEWVFLMSTFFIFYFVYNELLLVGLYLNLYPFLGLSCPFDLVDPKFWRVIIDCHPIVREKWSLLLCFNLVSYWCVDRFSR